MQLLKIATLLCTVLIGAAQLRATTPPGLEILFQQVEPGRPFHPLWPPLIGDDGVGTIVIARDPGKIQAFFETIESPEFSNPGVGQFEKETIEIKLGELARIRMTSADIAFSQLDAISNTMLKGKSAKNLVGKVNFDLEIGDKPSGNVNDESGNAGGSSKTGASAKQPNSETADQGRTKTGIDFSKFSQATITIPKVRVRYYTLATLQKMAKTGSESILSQSGIQVLSKAGRGWIISRVLIADSIDYEVTSTSKVDAGLFAKLLAWLPTASVRYKGANAVSISTNSPIILGYKLWRPERGLVQAMAEIEQRDLPGDLHPRPGSEGGVGDNKDDNHNRRPGEIGADEIDRVLSGKYDKSPEEN